MYKDTLYDSFDSATGRCGVKLEDGINKALNSSQFINSLRLFVTSFWYIYSSPDRKSLCNVICIRKCHFAFSKHHSNIDNTDNPLWTPFESTKFLIFII